MREKRKIPHPCANKFAVFRRAKNILRAGKKKNISFFNGTALAKVFLSRRFRYLVELRNGKAVRVYLGRNFFQIKGGTL